jgi:hypothetical protein
MASLYVQYRSDFEYVEELASQYVHDDKLCFGYEEVRAITALTYEIGENGEFPREVEEAAGCGEEGEVRTHRTHRAQRDSSMPSKETRQVE